MSDVPGNPIADTYALGYQAGERESHALFTAELARLRKERDELRRLLHKCEDALTRYAHPPDAAHWPPMPPRALLKSVAVALATHKPASE